MLTPAEEVEDEVTGIRDNKHNTAGKCDRFGKFKIFCARVEINKQKSLETRFEIFQFFVAEIRIYPEKYFCGNSIQRIPNNFTQFVVNARWWWSVEEFESN